MRDFSALYSLPNNPAVYAFYSGGKGSQYVVYVGIAGKLKQRITQHLIRRDSSAAVGTSSVNLKPDYITSMSWWEHLSFDKTVNLKAAELIAFEILNPALRSRAGIDTAGKRLLEDKGFRESMERLFIEIPTGSITFPSLSDAMKRIAELEKRVLEIEKDFYKLKK
jgi:hypothetical protein